MTLVKKLKRAPNERHIKEYTENYEMFQHSSVWQRPQRVNVWEHTVHMALHDTVTITWCHIYCIFTNIHAFLIDKDFSECQNISPFSRVLFYVCLSSGDTLPFHDKNHLLLFLFLFYLYFGTFLFQRSYRVWNILFSIPESSFCFSTVLNSFSDQIK